MVFTKEGRDSKMSKKRTVWKIAVLTVLCILYAGYSIFLSAEEPWQAALIWNDIGKGNVDAVKKALDKGLDPNSISPIGYPLLQTAVADDHPEIVNLLLKYGADPKRKGCEWLVETAINNDNFELAKLLIKAGAVVRRPADFCCIWDDPLVDAVGKNNLEMVNFLLTNGADANASGLSFKSALHSAATLGNIEIMKILLAAGANINQRDGFGRTALMFACEKGHFAAVEFLLSQGADPNLATSYGDTALSVAQKISSPDKDKIIETLQARIKKK